MDIVSSASWRIQDIERWLLSASRPRSDMKDEISQSVGVTPFVIVPGENLDQVAMHSGFQTIHAGGQRTVQVVGRCQRFLTVTQDSFQRPVGCRLEALVHLLPARLGPDCD